MAPYSKKIGWFTPMLATLAKEPFSGPDWLFEVKFDGYRALSFLDGKNVEIYSRNHNSFNKNYPKNCLWIAPPDSSFWSADIKEEIFVILKEAIHKSNKVLGTNCGIFDSRKVTHYPLAPGEKSEWNDHVDGIHYSHTPLGTPIVDNWMKKIAEFLPQ